MFTDNLVLQVIGGIVLWFLSPFIFSPNPKDNTVLFLLSAAPALVLMWILVVITNVTNKLAHTIHTNLFPEGVGGKKNDS